MWRRSLVRGAVLAVGLLGTVAIGPPAALATAYDTFDESTFNTVDALGKEVPYTGATQFTRVISDIDSSGFGLQAGERGGNTDQTGCSLAGGGFAFGGRTAWVRFVPGVSGTLGFQAIAGFDVIAWVRSVPYKDRGLTTFFDVASNPSDCIDTFPSPIFGESIGPESAVPGRVLYFEVAGLCGRGADISTACPDATAAAGGPMQLKVTFTPDNQDGDGVADTLDTCKTVAGTATNGCPDSDGDGVGESPDGGATPGVDQCVGVKGDTPVGCLSTDADRDGFRTDTAPRDCNDDNSAVKPGAVEVVNNAVDENCDGVTAYDRDGDGSLLGVDCDDNDPLATPGAGHTEIRGNRRDEDCVGGAAPYPVLSAAIQPSFQFGSYKGRKRAGLRHLTVRRSGLGVIPKGLRIEVRCFGTGCPLGATLRRYRVKRATSILRLAGPIERARLAPGAKVEIRFLLTQTVGRTFTYTVDRVRLLAVKPVIRCVQPGTSEGRRCFAPPSASPAPAAADRRPPTLTATVRRRGARFVITLRARDPSGIRRIDYRLKPRGPFRVYRRPLRLTRGQARALRWRAVDRAGNVSRLTALRLPRPR